jgi:hypothetical protein
MREIMMAMTRIGRVPRYSRWPALRVSAAALAAVSVMGAVPPAVASASPQQALDWTNQAPAAHPTARFDTSMAYDAATSTVVLFGGRDSSNAIVGDTWTWDGTTWTKQHPATSPPARIDGAMAYDAATGTVVLFGGFNGRNDLADTWTWDGTTWTKQAPATSPPPRGHASMAYDAATGTVVLFGGEYSSTLADTWTWDGTTWTKQHPATSPPARIDAAMAYDAATSTVVLFGGDNSHGANLADTWTWDGTTWTQQAPATSPRAREMAYMAYDAATGTAVLFGGFSPSVRCDGLLGDTWTWDGTTWTQQVPATRPSVRADGAMAYDAATGTAVLFGGYDYTTNCPVGSQQDLAQTWTWG